MICDEKSVEGGLQIPDDPITRWPDILPSSPRQDMMSANERLAPWRTVNISQKSWKV